MHDLVSSEGRLDLVWGTMHTHSGRIKRWNTVWQAERHAHIHSHTPIRLKTLSRQDTSRKYSLFLFLFFSFAAFTAFNVWVFADSHVWRQHFVGQGELMHGAAQSPQHGEGFIRM